MSARALAGKSVSAIGLGCMNLSHAYGATPTHTDARRVLLGALELGVSHFDTAALYGFGENETVLGQVLRPHRNRIFLASKGGMKGVGGKRVIDGRPQTIRQTCEESLRRLQTDHLDLYYLHRWDKSVPLEDSIGALAELAKQGKIRAVGMSEVSAATLRRANKVHAISAVQSEYSLFTRNPELGVLDACQEIGAAFVAFAPLGRGLLAKRQFQGWADSDIRRAMPRFNPPHLFENLRLAETLHMEATALGVPAASLALAWLLHRRPNILPIPGTTSLAHLQANARAAELNLEPALLDRLDRAYPPNAAVGPRYSSTVQAEIDTEEY